ncbi:glycoside hydrolase family 31 protein [Zasmidium cellare ATCC 36951]|uniref:alpha-glucosidase n=1 Tax=Zasmidium cellare ATCC 36951 TaxID=1080233 RepID=A0A6A6CS82_ZASCE|nr:glycoside hydrolase family 31 protein [Zasmidium cellare ATCC 36951]KAF2170137.1 glycoside hydrolase family 31 protein [Zasmidium cellare ATCC 36951]
MARFGWKQALLAISSSLAYAQDSTSSNPADGLTTTAYGSSTTGSIASATVSGATSTFSIPFTVPASADIGPNVLPNVKDPNAKQAQALCPGYKASNVSNTEFGFTATLGLAGDACNVYGTDIETLSFELDVQSAHRMRILIQPAYLDNTNRSQYILNENIVPAGQQGFAQPETQSIDLQFSWTNEPTFAFTVVRKSTGDVLFDTTGSVLVYENQFIEFASQMPENYNIYGMGERIHGLRLGNNFTATSYAADVGDPIDQNIYGVHPFYLDTRYYEVDEETGEHTLVTTQNTTADGEYVGLSHGVFLRNAHGMEALMLPTNLTWRTIGGSIDLYIFDGPTQEKVTKQYQIGAIGLPVMQSYWTFGFHQCRWGYENWTELEAVVNTYRDFDIPLETVWTDIDYMFQYRDFTNDQNTFPYGPGQEFLSRLHANGQHYVPIVDSAIYIPNPYNASDNYSIYTDGNDRGVFLKNPDGSQYIGSVWPGYTVFPDWHAAEAVPWWTDSMEAHHKNVPWDGIWIDMSEVSSFCIGSCGTGNLSLNPVHPPFGLPGEEGNKIFTYPEGFNLTNATEASAASSLSASQSSAVAAATTAGPSTTAYVMAPAITPDIRNVNQPPYVINNVQGDLAVHAVSPNATHIDGVEEYDVHSLFGHQILNATYQALLHVFPEKRPFIIGRSTFAGSGKYAGHWGGDNTSLFAYMYFSISQALNFALFGIPMFGVDTCGFNGNSDEELCNRWMQLSAFFPFYRNHNTLSANSQEAYVWASVAEATKKAMNIRYSLLPYMYTLFYYAHTTGSTVMRALSWEFPNDPTLAAVDTQFLLGPAILVAPALGQGQTEVQAVFPGVKQGEVWYDWYTQEAMSAKPGENVTIAAPLSHIPVFVRGGYILPQQEALYTTTESRNSSWSLITALDKDGSATGQIYLDDGESIAPPSSLLVELTASNGTLWASSRGLYKDTNSLANVTVLGVQSEPKSVTLNGMSINSGLSYNSTSKVLSLKGLQNVTSSGAWASDWTLKWS